MPQSKTSKKLMDFCAKAPVLVSVPLIYLTFMTCASMQIKVCSVKFYVISTMCCSTFILSLPPCMVTLSGVLRNTAPTTPTVPACIYGTHTVHGNLTPAQTYAVGRALPAIVISVLTEIISPLKIVSHCIMLLANTLFTYTQQQSSVASAINLVPSQVYHIERASMVHTEAGAAGKNGWVWCCGPHI